MYKVTWDEYFQGVRNLIKLIPSNHYDCILAISRGGTIAGTILSHQLTLPMAVIISQSYDNEHQQKEVQLSNMIISPLFKVPKVPTCLIVDDLLDTGKTVEAIKKIYKDWSFDTAMLFHKGKCKEPNYWVTELNDWIEFPYEEFS